MQSLTVGTFFQFSFHFDYSSICSKNLLLFIKQTWTCLAPKNHIETSIQSKIFVPYIINTLQPFRWAVALQIKLCQVTRPFLYGCVAIFCIVHFDPLGHNILAVGWSNPVICTMVPKMDPLFGEIRRYFYVIEQIKSGTLGWTKGRYASEGQMRIELKALVGYFVFWFVLLPHCMEY